jgi:hypothetical protein
MELFLFSFSASNTGTIDTGITGLFSGLEIPILSWFNTGISELILLIDLHDWFCQTEDSEILAQFQNFPL